MKKGTNIEVHDTAFITSTFRAIEESISHDRFAKLWRNAKTEKWVIAYLEQVCTAEAKAHALRNRFFLDTIKTLIQEQKIEVLINFGSGFSMYPYLLEDNVIHIEIDKPEIVNFKALNIKAWQHEGRLPARNIHFLGVDFGTNYQKDLSAQITALKGDKSCFILVEGVLFFLSRKETDDLFDFFSSIQRSGDLVGSASFEEDVLESSSFRRLLNFMKRTMLAPDLGNHQIVEKAYYHDREGYTVIDRQDFFSLSKRYGIPEELEKELILNESYYILEKGFHSSAAKENGV